MQGLGLMERTSDSRVILRIWGSLTASQTKWDFFGWLLGCSRNCRGRRGKAGGKGWEQGGGEGVLSSEGLLLFHSRGLLYQQFNPYMQSALQRTHNIFYTGEPAGMRQWLDDSPAHLPPMWPWFCSCVDAKCGLNLNKPNRLQGWHYAKG